MIQDNKELLEAGLESLNESTLIYMPHGINPYGGVLKNEHIMAQMLTSVAQGKMSMDEGIDWAADELRRIIKDLGEFK